MEFEEKRNFLINTAYFAVMTALIYIAFKYLFLLLMPFVIGLVLAFLSQKPAKKLSEKTHISTGTLASVIVIFAYVLLALVIFVLFWLIFSKTGNIFSYLSKYVNEISEEVIEMQKNVSGFFAKNSGSKNAMSDFFSNTVKSFAEKLSGFISSFATETAKFLPGFLISSIVTVVASCYIAKDYNKLALFLKNLINNRKYENLVRIKNIITGKIKDYISGYLLLSLITFFELLTGFLIIKQKYAFILAVLVAVIDLLPVLGTGTVLIPWTVYLFITADYKKGIFVLCLYVIIILVRNFCEPHIIGKKIGINPLFTLAAIFLGFKISGFAGMILAPVALIVVVDYYSDNQD